MGKSTGGGARPDIRPEENSSETASRSPKDIKPSPAAKKKPGQAALLLGDLLALLAKIAAVAAFAAVMFSFIFGIYRCTDPYMQPYYQDGDLVVFYRTDRSYVKGDVAVLEYQGRKTALRVLAVAGDEVDITDTGLSINGYPQSEGRIYELTERFQEGVEFPLTVGEGEVFLLGDSRENAADSRIFGPVSIEDTFGQVIGLLRRRNL